MSYEQDRFKEENFVQLLARPGTRLILGDVGFIEEVDGEAKLVLTTDTVEALKRESEFNNQIPEGTPAIFVDENRVLTYLVNTDGYIDIQVKNRHKGDKIIVTLNVSDKLIEDVVKSVAQLAKPKVAD